MTRAFYLDPADMTNLPSVSGGLRLVVNAGLVTTDTKVTHRTWKERLFSLPWKPLLKEEVVTTVKPDEKLYNIQNKYLVGHPVTLAKYIDSLGDEGFRGDTSRV